MRRADLTGQRFNRLTAEEFAYSRSGNAHWTCLCDCGKRITCAAHSLKNGHTGSCGCLHSEMMSKNFSKHRESKSTNLSTEYVTWSSIKARCYNPKNQDYHRYGGRGITMCERWLNSYESFLADMGRKSSPELSIDRINNDGNYEPSNCRWATAQQQADNRGGMFARKNGERHA